MLKIRWLWDHLIFNIGIPKLLRRHFYIKIGPLFFITHGSRNLYFYLDIKCSSLLKVDLYVWNHQPQTWWSTDRSQCVWVPPSGSGQILTTLYGIMYDTHRLLQCIRSHMRDMTLVWHDGVIKWKHFLHYWPFVWGIHRSPVNSPHKGQWRGALMFSLICTWPNGWVNNWDAGDLRHHGAHYDITVMNIGCLVWYSVWHRKTVAVYMQL